MSRALRRLAPALLLVAVSGCAYFNGIYNAREQEKKADRLARRGEEGAARSAYLESAQKAETVLTRHGKSRWRADALYLAGRGAALGGACEQGVERLRQYLAVRSGDARRRERAELALGVCAFEGGRLREARERLAPLRASRDRDIARTSALWDARVSMRLGDTDEAARLLATVESGVAQWELAGAAVEAGQWVRAESLLTQRAIRGDWREGAVRALDEMWAAGQDSAVLRLARHWSRASTPVGSKVRLHLHMGDLALAAGRDSLAGEHLREAQRLSTDANVDRESASRLLVVRVAEADSIRRIDEVLRDAQRVSGDTPFYQRLASNALLLHLLIDRAGRDAFGTGYYLAAEVARDSLRNPRVAHRLFRVVADSVPSSPMAPSALLAAALLLPDSAERYRDRVRAQYADTPAGYMLAGRDPAELPAWRFMDEQFRARWSFVTRLHRDSVSRLRPGTAQQAPPPGSTLGQNP